MTISRSWLSYYMTDNIDYLEFSYMIIVTDDHVSAGGYKIDQNRKRRGDDFIPDVLNFYMTAWMAKDASRLGEVMKHVEVVSMFLNCEIPYHHYVFKTTVEMNETWEQISDILVHRTLLKEQLETYLNTLVDKQLKML